MRSQGDSAMISTSAIAEIAALVGDPARTNMLSALMDGRALTATELAHAAGVTPQTASAHLARLTDAGLLASRTVAHMLESIMAVAAMKAGDGPVRQVIVGPRDKALRHARTCYDHLAGQVAVAMADKMVQRGHIELSADGGALTAPGADFLQDLGIDIEDVRAAGRRHNGRIFCRPCLDWSERRPHIAGSVGAALCGAYFRQGWIRRIDGSRAVAITAPGQIALRKAFGPEILP
jgi:DNA-binding transcriptional ArsR family regulator